MPHIIIELRKWVLPVCIGVVIGQGLLNVAGVLNTSPVTETAPAYVVSAVVLN